MDDPHTTRSGLDRRTVQSSWAMDALMAVGCVLLAGLFLETALDAGRNPYWRGASAFFTPFLVWMAYSYAREAVRRRKRRRRSVHE